MFKESSTALRLGGLVLIILGVVLISRGTRI
jgi:multidrug transporter EmrE-like cation transporter